MDLFQWRVGFALVACAGLGGPALGCSGKSHVSLTTMLPADHAVESWVRAGAPVTLTSDTDLYNQIDGGAPKYIDRGWQGSVYAEYDQGAEHMQVAIHDMGSGENAQAIFAYDLPVSRVVIKDPNAVVDLGLPTAYGTKAYVGQCYVETTIDQRSDAALASIESFTLAILESNGAPGKP
jgi:hypothetical protein